MDKPISYSPGPWQIINHQGSVYDTTKYPTVAPGNVNDLQEGWRPPARFYLDPTPIDLSETEKECEKRHRRAYEQQLADARLIAASPELIEVCKAAKEVLERHLANLPADKTWNELEELYENISAAINHAIGEQHINV